MALAAAGATGWFGLAAAAGVGMGVALGSSRRLRGLLDPVVMAFHAGRTAELIALAALVALRGSAGVVGLRRLETRLLPWRRDLEV